MTAATSGNWRAATTGLVLAVTLALGCAIGCDAASNEPPAADAAATSTEPDTSTETDAKPPPKPPKTFRVARVIDGDTLELRNGKRVRLVQIDAPESDGECYGAQAGAALRRLLPAGTRVVLEGDPRLDKVDRYGRLLRYVHAGKTNVNLTLVRRGAASVWFFEGDRGRYASQLLAAARQAKRDDRGAWGACRAKLDPTRAFDTRPIPLPPTTTDEPPPSCADGYSPCLPITGDLDCDDVRALGKAPVRVTGSDPYRLDGDGDGTGCE